MKRKLFLGAMAAVVAMFGASSCTKDASINEGGPGGEISGFSLQIQVPQGAFVTRAGETIASDKEFMVNNLFIYAFDGDKLIVDPEWDETAYNDSKFNSDANKNEAGGLLRANVGCLAPGVDYKIVTNGGVSTVEFNPGWLAPYIGKELTFYVLANDYAIGANDKVFNGMAPIEEDITKAAFENKMVYTTHDGSGEWGEPFVMEELAGGLLMTGQSTPVRITGNATSKIVLKRRTARFDIVLPKSANDQLELAKIEIFNAPVNGNVFSSGIQGVPLRANIPAEWGGFMPLYGNGGYVGFPMTSGAEFQTEPNPVIIEANTKGREVYRIPSVFYMWPTILSPERDPNKMNIYIKVNQESKEFIFTPANEVEIRANYRYSIILNPGTLTFTIEVADYDEGGDIEAPVGGDDDFSAFSVTPEAAIEGNLESFTGPDGYPIYSYHYDDNATGTITVKVTSEFGTNWEEFYPIGVEASVKSHITSYSVNKTSSTVKVNGHEIVDTYTITVPKGDGAPGNCFYLRIKSPNGKAERIIVFDGGGMKLEHFFPDVQAQYFVWCAMMIENPNFEVRNIGGINATIYLEDLMAVTTINQSTFTNNPLTSGIVPGDGSIMLVNSLIGFRFLPNLKDVTLNIGDDMTAMDFSYNTKLARLVLMEGRNVTSLDITRNLELEKLVIQGFPKLASVDMSQNEKLGQFNSYLFQHIDIYREGQPDIPVGLKRLEFKNNPGLISCSFSDAHLLETVDVSGAPNLLAIELTGSMIQKLDVRNNRKLQHLYVNENVREYEVLLEGTYNDLGVIYLYNGGLTSLDLTKVTAAPSLNDIRTYNSPKLTSVKIPRAYYDDGILAVPAVENTITVDMHDCPMLTGHIDFYSLGGLNLNNTGITGVSVFEITQWAKALFSNIAGGEITVYIRDFHFAGLGMGASQNDNLEIFVGGLENSAENFSDANTTVLFEALGGLYSEFRGL